MVLAMRNLAKVARQLLCLPLLLRLSQCAEGQHVGMEKATDTALVRNQQQELLCFT